ncbi:MAG: hypothetical protein HYT80_11175 [Euryarchaeota archaeon]|nr:hypothetical protein [Euryarchaeota archaeon]
MDYGNVVLDRIMRRIEYAQLQGQQLSSDAVTELSFACVSEAFRIVSAAKEEAKARGLGLTETAGRLMLSQAMKRVQDVENLLKSFDPGAAKAGFDLACLDTLSDRNPGSSFLAGNRSDPAP